MQKMKKIYLAVLIFALVAIGVLGAFLILNKQDTAPTGNKADVSWYTEDGKEFVISTVDELYGLVKLSEYYDFSGQTIKLGADIVVNEGNAEDWAKKAPSKRWFPIDGFAGTFNGQGHTISGIYGNGVDTAMGLFSNTKMSCSIKDFKLLNSYFKVDGLSPVGSIVANGCGSLEKIYSDAIVTSNGENVGGIIGNANDDGTVSATAKTSKITNCWFDGEVRLTTKTGRYGGGIVGRVFGGTLNITHCLNSGNISAESTESNGLYVGGIFGALTYTNFSGAVTLEDTLNVGKIDVQKATATGSIAGGTLANTSMIIKDTYTTEQSYTEVCSYQKSSTTGGVPMMNADFIQGEEWYSWTTLNYDQYWTVTKDSTPVLRCFADEVVNTTGLAKAYSFDWYNQYAQESIIDSVEDLYGFALMSYSETFQNKVVKLGADITVNEGKATQWASGKNIPDNCWLPIGRTPAFQGIFDGNGYTISGVYGTTRAPFMGLFGWIGNNSEVKNFRLTNSFFELTSTSASALGSVTGRLEGKVDTIYSDAIISTVGVNVGGIVGYKLTDIESSVTNCWYNGTINMIGDSAKNVGGVMGRLINGTIEIDNCLFSGTINMGGKKRTVNAGGFIGNIAAGTVALKGSLNSGELITTDVEQVYASGRVFGQVADSDTIKITFENTYFTDKGGTYFWYCAGKKPTVIGGAELKLEKDILGYGGYRTTGLDFDKYWSVVVNQDGTPILKSFAKNSPSVAGLEKTFDKSWYSQDKTTYVLSDAKDLYGFLYLSNSKIDFAGKTVTLGNDIVVNAGNAADWAAGKNLPDSVYNWGGIGKYTNFQGTFDGQGYTISGIYGTSDTSFLGLFGWVGTEGTVKNLRLTNSYLESTVKDSAAIGSIAGRLEGDIHTVYSDAIIKTQSALNGGIAGYKLTADTKSSITNSWYAGTMYMVGNDSKHSGGIVGRVIGGELELNSCLFTGKISIGGETRSANTGGLVGNVNGTLVLKSCLNNGVFEVTEADKMNSTCRVIGQVSNVDTANVTMENTYFTNKGDNGTWFWYNTGDKATIVGGAELKEEEDLLGFDGFITTALDFDNYWTVVVDADGAPILKSFANNVPSVAGLEKNFDTSWYDADKKTYVLEDRKDLYGFLYLSNSNINFKGKTVKLGKDITVNESGTAAEWAAGTLEPTHEWSPIGKYLAFEGTFDGKGKTISGLCGTTDTSFMGLFGWVGTSGTVKNLSLKNSYFESTVKDSAAIGSIAGRLEGDIHTVYSDAIIKTPSALNGGIAGYKLTADTKSSITNSWYAGTMYMVGNDSKHSGGIVGRVIGGELELNSCLFTGKISIGGETRSANTGGLVGNVNGTLVIKSSLNNGEFEVTETDKMNSTCRVIGQVSNVDTANVTMENTYFTNKGDNGTWFWYNTGDKATIKGGAELKEEKDILGYDGFRTTALDFDNYWTVVLNADGAPILKSFASKVPSVAGQKKLFDTSWYDEDKTTYVLNDREDLYGFVYLSNSNINFKGKTVTLGRNITVNTSGTAAEWEAGTAKPTYEWSPVGKYLAFEGTFDGKEKTISGLCGTTDTTFMGLFGWVGTSGTVKNVILENSYFESTVADSAAIGSIAGRLEGNVDTVKSDAIVKSSSALNGGLVGYKLTDTKSKITNSWYAGQIYLGANAGHTGGIAGRVIGGTLEIANCLFSGTISIDGETRSANTGGFVGNTNGKVILKSSLNTGVFEVTEADKMNSTCRVIGQISDVDTAHVVMEDTYFTNEGDNGTWYWYNTGDKATIEGYAELKEEEDILGYKGYDTTSLDFDYWTVVLNEDGTPILKDFASKTPLIIGRKKTFDTSWYEDKTYVLDSREDLYGLVYLSNSNINFKDITIKLGDDITVNTKGTAEEWAAGTATAEYEWSPIGKYIAFEGTLDGWNEKTKTIQTISGLCGTSDTPFMGLFGWVGSNGEIQNLRLENSYFESTSTSSDGAAIGSIAGRMDGNLDTVYSDAIITSCGALNGGIAGYKNSTNESAITNSWYAGTMNLTAKYNGGIISRVIKGSLEIDNCLFSGEIYLDEISGNIRTGGFIGNIPEGISVSITNSLNSGEFIKETDNNMTALCRVIGESYGAVHTENVYFTNKGEGGTSTWYAPGTETGTTPEMVAEGDIKGEDGYYFTELDFDKYWTIVLDNEATTDVDETGAPVLQSFADVLQPIPTAPDYADISWYDDENKLEYEICDRDDLYGLAYLVRTGISFEGKTVKIADKDEDGNPITEIAVNTEGTAEEWAAGAVPEWIWEPIGERVAFAGTFDGNGKTISGIYVNTDEQGAGLFRSTAEGSTIQNLKVLNSYFNNTTSYTGSIVGKSAGNLVNVYSEAYVNGVSYTGGLIGYIYGENTETIEVSNCWFAGYVTATNVDLGGLVGAIDYGVVQMTDCLNSATVNGANQNFVGGLVGGMTAAAKGDVDVTMTRCLNVGKLTNVKTASGSFVGSVLGRKNGNTAMTVVNVYGTNESHTQAVGSTSMPIGTVTMLDERDITGVCASYNKILVNTDAWVATETTPELEMFSDTEFTVPELSADVDITWYEGFGTTEYTICDEATNEENVAELNGFAYLVNAGITFDGMTVKLGNDVEVNEEIIRDLTEAERAGLKAWTPIGTIEKPFAGTFDGGLHSISGLYATADSDGLGLFAATAEGSTVQNVKVLNSHFENAAKYTGSIIGKCNGNLINVYSEASVRGSGYVGGLIGYICTKSTEDINVSNCWFAGNLATTGNQSGGIVGTIYGGTVKMTDCLNTGLIDCGGTNRAFIGGICGGLVEETGYVVDVTMSNCLNVGKLTNCSTAEDSSVGAIYGRRNGGAAISVTNVYATKESYFKAVGYTNMPSGTVVMVNESDITGELVYYNKILVDTDAWVATETTPELEMFSDTEFVIPKLPDDVDITWYKGIGATEHTIGANEDNDTNVKELKGLSYLVNAGVSFAGMTVKLDDDVEVNKETIRDLTEAERANLDTWTPIGTIEKPFKGTFDGGLHSISGLYATANSDGMGLFAATAKGSTIQNLKVLNSYFNNTTSYTGSIVGKCAGNLANVYSEADVYGDLQTGGLVGQIYGEDKETLNISNCWFAGKLVVTDNQAGGLIGSIDYGKVTMTDCLNTGIIQGNTGKSFIGGLVGGMTAEASGDVNVTMTNCLNTGKLTNVNTASDSWVGAILGRKNGGAALTVTNVYGTYDSYHKAVGGTSMPSGTVVMVNESDITGDLAYTNKILVNTANWVVTETTPALKVFTKGKVPEGVNISWYKGSETKNYTICDETTNEDNVAELKGLAYLVNAGVSFDGITITLGNDVEVNEETISELTEAERANLDTWTPIGTIEKPFDGTFDGGLHSISGLYATADTDGLGLFAATAAGSTVQNVKLLNSYFNNTTSYTGSIIGKCAGNLVNVYSEAEVYGDLQTGGLIGQVYAENKTVLNINTCWFAGKLVVTDNQAGGLIGSINYGVVHMTDCLNKGTIQGNTTKAFIGGLVGGMTANASGDVNVAMTNCLNTGKMTKVNTADDSWVGAILGRKNGSASVTVTNVYGTKESYSKAVGGTSIPSGIVMVNESDITVSAPDNISADTIKTGKLSGLFTANGKWTIGTTDGSTPELKMELSNTTASLFTRVAMAIQKVIAN